MKIRLCSNEKDAAEATDRTLQALPGFIGGSLLRGVDGEILFDVDGLVTGVPRAQNSRFFADAIVRQGYVRQVFTKKEA